MNDLGNMDDRDDIPPADEIPDGPMAFEMPDDLPEPGPIMDMHAQPDPGSNRTDDPLYNLEVEIYLLGSLMLDPNILDLCEGLESIHFAYEGHAVLFDRIRESINETQSADPPTIMHTLEMHGELEKYGGKAWFAEIATSYNGKASAKGYQKIIRDLYARREMQRIGMAMHDSALHGGVDPKEMVEQAERQLSELTGDSIGQKPLTTAEQANRTLHILEERYNDPNTLIGLSTGLTRLDQLLAGLQDSDLIILAARPSMGKTALAQCFAHHNIDNGKHVAFFSLEMTAPQIMMRLASSVSNIPLQHIRTGRYRDGKKDFPEVVLAANKLGQLPLHIDDTPSLSALGIWARCRRLKRQGKLDMVVIDQLSHIKPHDRAAKRVESLGQITKDLKAMAKELNVPVVLLHQLSRGVEMRDDKRPLLSDLRDSGEVEQDADVVMFVYREQYYLERSEPAQRPGETTEKFARRLQDHQERLNACLNTASVIIAKQRMGTIGTAQVAFHGAYTRFANLQRDEPHQEEFL